MNYKGLKFKNIFHGFSRKNHRDAGEQADVSISQAMEDRNNDIYVLKSIWKIDTPNFDLIGIEW